MADPALNERKGWMGLMAKTPPERLARALRGMMQPMPGFVWLRSPEVGAAMVQGRTGATGAPFNLGEMTVTRCSLRLKGGQVGHAYVQGRDKDHAMRAALVDALMQTDRQAEVRDLVLAPIEAERIAERGLRAAKAAATKVDFFTMVRGDN